MTKGCVTFIEGTDEFSNGTYSCGEEYAGCVYQVNGRCCFNVATIQQSYSRACRDDINESEVPYMQSIDDVLDDQGAADYLAYGSH